MTTLTISKKTSSPRGVRVSGALRAALNASVRSDLIVTPRLSEWLIQNDGHILPTPAIAERMKKILLTPPRNRVGTFSPSAAGTCMRRQELAFLGAPMQKAADARLGMIFNDGTWRHLRWQTMLLTAGIIDGIETKMYRPSLHAVGSMDGEGTAVGGRWHGREFGVELKGMNLFQYKVQSNLEPTERHLKQVDRYFWMSGHDLFVILYENKFNNDWKEWVITRDQKRVDEAQDELLELNVAIQKRRLHPVLPMCSRKRGDEYKSCPFGGEGGVCLNTGNWPRGI